MDKNNKKYFYPLIFCIYVLMFCLLIAFPHPLPGRISTKLRIVSWRFKTKNVTLFSPKGDKMETTTKQRFVKKNTEKREKLSVLRHTFLHFGRIMIKGRT